MTHPNRSIVCVALVGVATSVWPTFAERLGSRSGLTVQQPSSVSSLLAVAGAYMADYERQCSAIVALEKYEQVVHQPTPSEALDRDMFLVTDPKVSRRLRSDVLVLNLGDVGWIGFRDVFEVDGLAVRDHDERLRKLFLSPSPDLLDRAKQIVQESARFNVGGVIRTINLPTLALTFLRKSRHQMSEFAVRGTETVAGVRVHVLEFVERAATRRDPERCGSPRPVLDRTGVRASPANRTEH